MKRCNFLARMLYFSNLADVTWLLHGSIYGSFYYSPSHVLNPMLCIQDKS